MSEAEDDLDFDPYKSDTNTDLDLRGCCNLCLASVQGVVLEF